LDRIDGISLGLTGFIFWIFMSANNESLFDRLARAEVLEEFCELMFGQGMRYEDLMEQLEKWGISSSMGALSRFADSQRGEWSVRRARRLCEGLLKGQGVDLDLAQRKVVAERLFSLAASPNISEKALLKMRDQEIALAKLKQDDEKLKQNEVKLAQAQEQIDMQRRKIEALEAAADAAAAAAERAKETVRSGGMDEKTRAALIAEMDHLLLGKAKPQTGGAS
jgi:hypothetical protein